MSEQVVAVLVVVVVVPLVWWLMWLGWRGRVRRQQDVEGPAAAPQGFSADLLDGVEAVYVSTTLAGQYLERVAAHGLGVRAEALVRVGRDGVLLVRQGVPDVFVPRDGLLGVRLERGMIGKFVEREGLVVLTWSLGEATLDTGLRLRHRTDRARLVSAVGALQEVGT